MYNTYTYNIHCLGLFFILVTLFLASLRLDERRKLAEMPVLYVRTTWAGCNAETVSNKGLEQWGRRRREDVESNHAQGVVVAVPIAAIDGQPGGATTIGPNTVLHGWKFRRKKRPIYGGPELLVLRT